MPKWTAAVLHFLLSWCVTRSMSSIRWVPSPMGTPRIPIERSSPAATKVASISQGIAGYLLSLFAALARAYLDFRRKRRQESPFKRYGDGFLIHPLRLQWRSMPFPAWITRSMPTCWAYKPRHIAKTNRPDYSMRTVGVCDRC